MKLPTYLIACLVLCLRLSRSTIWRLSVSTSSATPSNSMRYCTSWSGDLSILMHSQGSHTSKDKHFCLLSPLKARKPEKWTKICSVLYHSKTPKFTGMWLRSQLANFSQFWSKFCHLWDQCKSSEKPFPWLGGGGRCCSGTAFQMLQLQDISAHFIQFRVQPASSLNLAMRKN